MAGRIIDMRKELFRLLTEELHTPGNWDHIVNQIGMFRYVARGFGDGSLITFVQFHGDQPDAEQGADQRGARVPDGERAHLDGGAEHEECTLLCRESGCGCAEMIGGHK